MTEMNGAKMLALNNNWLDATGGVEQTIRTAGSTIPVGSCLPVYNYYGHYEAPWSYPVYVSSPMRPIKLTLSEIERLRKASKADDKLKAILSKFTHQIEITVDFD